MIEHEVADDQGRAGRPRGERVQERVHRAQRTRPARRARTRCTLRAMPPAGPVSLATPVEDLPGVTPRRADLLRALGITNLGWLVAHLPTRFERVEPQAPISSIVPGRVVTAVGEVAATRPVRARRPRFEAVLTDGTGRLDVVWFNQVFLADKILPGMRLRVEGKASSRHGGVQMANPRWSIAPDEPPQPADGPHPEASASGEPAGSYLRPVYPASESLSSAEIRRIIARVLPLALPRIDDHLPPDFRSPRSFPELRDAYRMQHEPRDEDEAALSRRRLAYDELFFLQLGVHLKRAHLREALRAPALPISPALDAHIRARFPFPLTPAQDRVVREVAADLATTTPANRLIQGDVGSGKTFVAAYAMLQCVAAGHQASLMAPTEILAEQHAASLSRLLAGSRVRLALLTGSTPPTERASLLAALASGALDILVGTHALLTEGVVFKSLGVAVIDEQHRFGVHQRARLRATATDDRSTPHILVMTATPIPRTLGVTLFGDLDVSTIDQLPPGRSPVETRVFRGSLRDRVYAEVAARLAKGEQAYIVVPAIEGDDDPAGEAPARDTPLRDVRTVLAELEAGPLAGFRLAALHGRLARDTRDAVMERFRLGSIQALVATTVIEVGVDVPNATVIVIEQADRFGLAQLHQLRGRVGRGSIPSSCLLVADPATPEAELRLRAVASTTDGFALAETDFELRGPGELFGARQSGLPPFKVADLMRDRELLALARRDAAEWVRRSPRLDRPDEALLRRRLLKAYGPSLGLGDVG
ncbi:MAG: ATP-dependent DNA helicase RecG [Planctomycetota bacterium]|nr:ATP-dependent DNA helicase RecG [Planctomycetota bacterium]